MAFLDFVDHLHNRGKFFDHEVSNGPFGQQWKPQIAQMAADQKTQTKNLR